MPREKIITSIDVGSSKICTIVASVSAGRISVIGNSTVPSKGIDRGVVNDIDSAVEAIASSIEKAEKMSGHAISKAIITVNGQHIQSENSTGVVAVTDPQGEINSGDVMRVNEAAQAITIPSNREVVHVIPRDYVVDSQGNIKNPEGMSGVRLEVEAHIIHASTTVLKNLIKCVRQVGVEVSDLVYTGLASSHSVLTDTEKELGTVVADIGGRTTSCIVFQNGSPAYSFVVPIGGKHITGDIAVGLRCSLDVAEKIKLRVSEGENDSQLPGVLAGDSADVKKGELYVGDIDADLGTVPKKFVEKLTNDRVSEIITMLEAELKKGGFSGKIPAGAIITGGASQTVHMSEVAKSILKSPVRVAKPRGLTGLVDEIEGPSYSSCVGSILHKSQSLDDESNFGSSMGPGTGAIKDTIGKVKNIFKSLLP
jgi:cell division protein FtsA